MRALITGGAGFIGSHLSEALLDGGHDVLILDNLSTGSIDNISHLKGRPGFEYFVDSVNNEPLLAELIDRSDVVFHFAAAVGVKLIVEQPVYTIETNVHGTEVVLKHANKKKKLVVIASTSEVYGKSDDVPFREDSDLVMGPTPKHRWAYACSKAAVWMFTRILARELEADGINVNELLPGPVLTEMTATKYEARVRHAPEVGAEWFKQPEDVMPMLMFMATQPRRGPTGQSFSVMRRDL